MPDASEEEVLRAMREADLYDDAWLPIMALLWSMIPGSAMGLGAVSSAVSQTPKAPRPKTECLRGRHEEAAGRRHTCFRALRRPPGHLRGAFRRFVFGRVWRDRGFKIFS